MKIKIPIELETKYIHAPDGCAGEWVEICYPVSINRVTISGKVQVTKEMLENTSFVRDVLFKMLIKDVLARYKKIFHDTL